MQPLNEKLGKEVYKWYTVSIANYGMYIAGI